MNILRKIKVILFFFAVVFCLNTALSQDVSVELSLAWVGKKMVNADSVICYPKLLITYRNLSDRKLYFKKLSSNKNGIPKLPQAVAFQYDKDKIATENIAESEYKGKEYTVFIGGEPVYESGWVVYEKNADIEEEHCLDIINSDLCYLYDYMYSNKHHKKPFHGAYFLDEEIKESYIANVVKSDFAFLNPDETLVDTFDLYPFQILGGQYTFCLGTDKFSEYVLMEPKWDEEKLVYENISKTLPQKVNGYRLYSGGFYTNKLCVDFSH